MSDKVVSMEKLKEAISARVKERDEYVRDECLGDIGEQEVFEIIDTLAQSNELNQISSKDYGADGVGLTHAEVDALAEPVKTEAIDISELEKLVSFCKNTIGLNMTKCETELAEIRRRG